VPNPGDGVADLVVTGPPPVDDATAPQGQEQQMAAPEVLDAVTAAQIVASTAQVLHSMNEGHAFVMEQARLGHELSKGLVGAVAAQELRQSAQARETIQLSGAATQPRPSA